MNIDHHLKAYIFFLILSIALIWALAYLYAPGISLLKSDAINASSEVSVNTPESPSISKEVSEDALAARRIKLTKLLLRYQKELQDIEDAQKSAQVSDSSQNQEMESLRIKIDNIQSMIERLAQ